jgi:hypothetical protein
MISFSIRYLLLNKSQMIEAGSTGKPGVRHAADPHIEGENAAGQRLQIELLGGE